MAIKKLSFLFCLIGFLGTAQIYKIENEKLKGKIKSLALYSTENSSKEKLVEQQIFNTKGRLLNSKKYSEFDRGDKVRLEERNEYQPNLIITTICENCSDFDKVFAEFSKKDNQKYPYSGYGTNKPDIKRRIYKTTDKKGNIILEKYYNAEGYLISTEKNNYNVNSKLVSSENFDNENILNSYQKYMYNKNGLVTEEVSKNDTQPELKYTYSYDELGRKIHQKQSYDNRISETFYTYIKEKDTLKNQTFSFYNNEKKLQSVELIYPHFKNEIKEKQNINKDKISNRSISEYDDKKNLISQKFYDEKNEMIREANFSYDKAGNWVEIIMQETYLVNYNQDAPKPETRIKKFIRKIEYY